jgi:hypothetical protein
LYCTHPPASASIGVPLTAHPSACHPAFHVWHTPPTATAAAHQAKAASAAVLLTPDQARSANPEAHLSPWVLGACSAASAAAAGLLTHPADVVKTRLQVMLWWMGCL